MCKSGGEGCKAYGLICNGTFHCTQKIKHLEPLAVPLPGSSSLHGDGEGLEGYVSFGEKKRVRNTFRKIKTHQLPLFFSHLSLCMLSVHMHTPTERQERQGEP